MNRQSDKHEYISSDVDAYLEYIYSWVRGVEDISFYALHNS